ncbi:hypothetical protein RHMOL_Rhmol01G0001400 [Rhododendron molle]|uniref:Uncharacterized protein n=1 Tax=Rhododendron molle TaxID=49168 RepID=A0ACC0PZD2_RHOML|nr:hypothetical protein RHMOL_Rhmol01G0001400 [Rhododendron molle]
MLNYYFTLSRFLKFPFVSYYCMHFWFRVAVLGTRSHISRLCSALQRVGGQWSLFLVPSLILLLLSGVILGIVLSCMISDSVNFSTFLVLGKICLY